VRSVRSLKWLGLSDSICGSSHPGISGSRHSFLECESSSCFAPDALPKSANRVKRPLLCASALNQCLAITIVRQTREDDMQRLPQWTRTIPVKPPLGVGHFLVFQPQSPVSAIYMPSSKEMSDSQLLPCWVPRFSRVLGGRSGAVTVIIPPEPSFSAPATHLIRTGPGSPRA